MLLRTHMCLFFNHNKKKIPVATKAEIIQYVKPWLAQAPSRIERS